MLRQEVAVEKICSSLRKDSLVQAIFLKGSMGRDEHDEHSDIDLYCLVNEKDKNQFLLNRLGHLQAYKKIIFQDDIFIVAPQLIAVYEDLLHVDLFTVTEESFTGKDYIKVLYDPHKVLDKFKHTQGLTLTKDEYRADVMDLAWFIYRYKKSAARGNDVFSVRMLTIVVDHLARVLLYRYFPERAQLGLKTVTQSLPKTVGVAFIETLECITPLKHEQAANRIIQLVTREYDWIIAQLNEDGQTVSFLKRVIAY